MTRLELFRALRGHRKLAEQRMVDLNKNKVARWVIYISSAFVIIYLLIIAILLALAANASRSMSSIEFICCVAPIIFLVDFFCRFTMQQTPTQMVRPYVLLPIPKYTCVDFFIFNQLTNKFNLTWFVLLVPYCLMSVLFSFGLWKCIALLLFFWILELCISQFYLIVRTLINDTLLWWLMPLSLLIVLLLPGVHFDNISYITSNFSRFYDFTDLFTFYSQIGTYIEEGSALSWLILLLLVLLLYINRHVQYVHVMRELSREEKTWRVGERNRLCFFEKYGETGLFLTLEARTIARNKNPRKSFIMAMAIVVLFSMIIIFTELYDSTYMVNFLCLYNYILFGSITLVKIMCPEGNFLDGLMVRKENILQMLRAKYLFNCMMLFIPFALMMPTVVSGKWTFLMVFSYGVFTAGFQFFLLFQLAVTNRTSQPLNTKFTSRNGTDNSKWQIIVEMVCLLLPVVFVSVVQAIFNDTITHLIMFFIGLTFIATHRLWLHNIYIRFMNNRYLNMERFRASR